MLNFIFHHGNGSIIYRNVYCDYDIKCISMTLTSSSFIVSRVCQIFIDLKLYLFLTVVYQLQELPPLQVIALLDRQNTLISFLFRLKAIVLLTVLNVIYCLNCFFRLRGWKKFYWIFPKRNSIYHRSVSKIFEAVFCISAQINNSFKRNCSVIMHKEFEYK